VLTWFFALGIAAADPLEDLLVEELDRASQVLETQVEKPHYIALAIQDVETVSLSAEEGALAGASSDRSRYLDIDLRVGTPQLDSTHALRGFSALDGSHRERVQLPYEDGAEAAIRHTVWHYLDRNYRDAAERIGMVRANQSVKVEEESIADDFEPRQGVVDRREVPPLDIDIEAWKDALVELSSVLDDSPSVHNSSIRLEAGRGRKVFVDTEGARLIHGGTHARLAFNLSTTADDGDRISVFRSFDVHDPASLPNREELAGFAETARSHLEQLRNAPRGEPYSGPVMLKGRATGVFFHEVFGHRVEGHRQKRHTEGKTFAERVGERILPPFIDVYDDPTIAHLAGEDLNGFYAYDDEGVVAQRADLVDDGVFVGFLMSRSPIPGFDSSNGHGRRQAGMAPVARMANTIVQATRAVSEKKLREQLVAEIRSQGLEYGYIVDDIDGGFTLTGRVTPNAFNVRANTTWRVYADGRPDELVRGIDLVGTPLVAFANLVAASDESQVFNGSCGAESGWVPVSAVAPSVFFRRLEFQLKEKGQDKPPLLVKPSLDGSAEADE